MWLDIAVFVLSVICDVAGGAGIVGEPFKAKYAIIITTRAKSRNRPYFLATALEEYVNAAESQIIGTASLGFLTNRSNLARRW